MNIFGDGDEKLQRPDVVLGVLPDSAAMQLEVCQAYYVQPEQAAVRSASLVRVEQLLARGSLPAGEREYLQGEVHALRGQFAEAIASLARAVQSQPRQLAWRFGLAASLGERGRWDEARGQARILARAAAESPA